MSSEEDKIPSEVDVISLMSYLCPWSKMDTVHLLSAETVSGGNGAEVP